jgi:hypothetical protein
VAKGEAKGSVCPDRIAGTATEPSLQAFAGHLLQVRDEVLPVGPLLLLTTFRRKKPFSDDRATNLGARTRRQVAADKL